jgi:excisionase family DNA binding protein
MKLITLTEAAEVLRISKPTLHKWIKSGAIPAQAIHRFSPRGVRIDLEVLESTVATKAAVDNSQTN